MFCDIIKDVFFSRNGGVTVDWRIERISTPERILDKITNEMDRPVAIVLFGTSYDFKAEVYHVMFNKIQDLRIAWERTTEMALRVAKFPLCNRHTVLLVMSEYGTKHHSDRHLAVTKLREFGAQTVVGVVSSKERLKEPITVDGLDYLVVI